jgi:hypothetical protein
VIVRQAHFSAPPHPNRDVWHKGPKKNMDYLVAAQDARSFHSSS